jgi:hypothetical protein
LYLEDVGEWEEEGIESLEPPKAESLLER